MPNVVELPLLLLACASQIAFSQTKVLAISHRGEHLRHPENTLPAFQAAIDAGADFIEVDVRTPGSFSCTTPRKIAAPMVTARSPK
jgi:glycerophosphoryl diester phosphodiesterase